MKRRTFFQALACGGIGAIFSRIGFAGPTSTDPFWVHIHAQGGWDQALSIDPKPSLRNDALNAQTLYIYTQGNPTVTGATATELRMTPGGGIKYLGFADFHAGPNSSYVPLLPTYYDRITVFNGVDTATNNHEVGARYSASGSNNEGYPCFATQVACARGATLPLSFLNAGGYDETAGLISATPLNPSTLEHLLKAVNPNDVAGDNSGNDYFMDPAAFDKVRAAHQERIARIESRVTLPGQKRSILALKNAAAGQPDLAKLKFNAGDQSTTNLIRVAMEAYRQGLAVSLNLPSGGFDTHTSNEQGQILALFELFELVKFLLVESETPSNGGNAIPMVVIVTSDFGRTPHYTNGGTDHWPVSSVMLVQNKPAQALGLNIPTNRVIGGTTDGDTKSALQVQKVNPSTLDVDPSGITVTPEHVLDVLRRAAKIDKSSALGAFPLDIDKPLAIG